MSFTKFCAPLLLAVLAMVPGPVWANAEKPAGPDNLRILGWIENAYLIEPGFELKAKLDTGALTSSLDARIIKRFRQYGKRWVRFAVRDPETGEETVLVRERQRTIGIVQHEGDSDIRPTVQVNVCIAGIEREIEVSLVDRSRFRYALLLGRRTLKDIAIVHPGETFLSDSSCLEPPSESDHPALSPSREESAGEVNDSNENNPLDLR